jgi:hypothetical protein
MTSAENEPGMTHQPPMAGLLRTSRTATVPA